MNNQDKMLAIMAEVPPSCKPCLRRMVFVRIIRSGPNRVEVTYKCPKCNGTKVETR